MKIFFLLLLLASSSVGATTEIQALLPASESVPPWQPVDEPLRYRADTLYNFINGGAEVYLEYGFVQVVSQEYGQGDDSVICTIYEMKDPEAAYGIFSYNRTPQKQSVSMGDGGFKGGFQLAFWQERYYVIVESYSSGEKLEKSVSSFGKTISGKIGAHADEPPAVRRLPGKNLIDGSVKLLGGHLALGSLLFLGTPDLFELGGEDQILYGEYGDSEEKAKLFLVIYNEPEKASRIYLLVREAFAADRDVRFLPHQDASSYWTRQDRFFALGHGANALALVTDAASLDTARDILSRCWK